MRKGFTMVEILAVLVIVGLLLVLLIPGYISVYNGVKRNDLSGKISEIETAALKYGNKIKDEVKDSGNACLSIGIDTLIKEGLIKSEDESKPVIYNPTDNAPLDGKVKICYCTSDFDIAAYYKTTFDKNKAYHKGDVVEVSGKLYRCVIDYNNKSGINGTNDKGKRFFEEVKC